MRIEKFSNITEEMKEIMLREMDEVNRRIGTNTDKKALEGQVHKEMENWLAEKDVNGGICYEGNKVIGFMFAELKMNKEKRQAWVPSFGVAANGKDNDQILYELYKYCSVQWIELGFFEHIIEVLNIESKIESFQKLGFAFQQVHGLLKLEDYMHIANDSNIKIRKLNKEDEKVLIKFSDVIYRFQNASPVYVLAQPEEKESIKNGFAGLVDDEEVIFYIGESTEPVAFQGLWDLPFATLVPKDSIELVIAGTIIEEAHSGKGACLMNHVVKDLIEKGFKWMVTDWRITNISSRRFWNDKCGFNITKHRMIRNIEPDITWAKF